MGITKKLKREKRVKEMREERERERERGVESSTSCENELGPPRDGLNGICFCLLFTSVLVVGC